MKGKYQLFDALPPAVEAALRVSIDRFGVIVPVVKDQDGNIIDGHHRSRIAAELKKDYRVERVQVADEKEAREMARTLNADRRHLTEEQRREVVALLAAETVAAGKGGREEVARHSPNAIAGALGVDLRTVQKDIEQLTRDRKVVRPAKTLGQDGKVYPTRQQSTEQAQTTRKRGVGAKPRRPLPTRANEAGWALRKSVEQMEKIFADDRFGEYKDKVAGHVHGHLTHAVETLRGLLDRIDKLGAV